MKSAHKIRTGSNTLCWDYWHLLLKHITKVPLISRT